MENNNNVRNLKFRGQGSVLTGIFLVNLLLTVLTLGIYYAWAKVKTKKYIYSSTYLEESSFQYHATGKELFMGYLKVFVLVILFWFHFFNNMAISSTDLDTFYRNSCFLFRYPFFNSNCNSQFFKI